MVEARSASEAVEEQGNERRRVHGQLLVNVGVGGKGLVRAGVIDEAMDVATQSDDQPLLSFILEIVAHTHTHPHRHTRTHTRSPLYDSASGGQG